MSDRSSEVATERDRLTQKDRRALHLLQTCPSLPVDAFASLMGFDSVGGAYKRLARLKQKGLAEVRCCDVGFLVSERPLGLWTITDRGLRVLETFGPVRYSRGDGRHHGRLYTSPERPREAHLTMLVAAYRLLGIIVAERASIGQPVDVARWEFPYVRAFCSPERSTTVHVRLTACAVLHPSHSRDTRSITTAHATSAVLLIVDLGAAPVNRYRNSLRQFAMWRRGTEQSRSELIVATIDPDGHGTRTRAWLELLDRAGLQGESSNLPVRVVAFEDLVKRKKPTCRNLGHDARVHQAPLEATTRRTPLGRAPTGGRDQVLHLVGRHPFLSVQQLAALLGTTTARIRQLEDDLMDDGFLRHLTPADLSGGTTDVCEKLGIAEITQGGRMRLAALLGLEPAVATRYHGLVGHGTAQAGRRRRLLRHFHHTVGVNALFVAFATAARKIRRDGGTDQLAEWRSAAACERRHCKPDAYGCYIRNSQRHGFFLEYDRGTERARKYAAKLRAYYHYRDSGQARRDYDGFPTLLFVTTDTKAESRIAEAAYRVWYTRGAEPLPILITTTSRVAEDRAGVMGCIWRTPPPATSRTGSTRVRWLSNDDTLRNSTGKPVNREVRG